MLPNQLAKKLKQTNKKKKLNIVNVKEAELEAKKNEKKPDPNEVKLVTKEDIANGNGITDGSKRKKKKKNKNKNDLDLENEKESNGNAENEDELEDEETNGVQESKLPGSSVGLEILSNQSFDVLEGRVCEETLKGIADMGFTSMTEIQAKSIPQLLEGRDLVGSAKTGSGKTLAFLIPAIELIHKLKFMPSHGTGVIILSPTRELAMQTFGVLKELMKYHSYTYGLVMGGASRQTEAQKLSKGVNIVVGTPGRMLDHLQNNGDFLYKNLQCFIMDEADRILDIGFEEDLKQIINLIPKRRQTMLFSATQSKKTDALTALALKKEPVYVGVDDSKATATVSGLEQGYIVCPSEKRLLVLFTFLKKNRKKKVMVFFSSCMSVKYHHELFNYIDILVMSIHGRQKQTKRTETFFEFCNADSGILLCTDVAARGLDIPDVDWIVQYDPPDDPKEYIHRVGRTARGEGKRGHALLILRPEELGFLRYLKQSKVNLNEYEFSWSKISDIQMQLETLISKNYFLHQSAKEAYKGYLRAYDSHHLKTIFDINTLDVSKVCLAFGFKIPPAVDLIVSKPIGDRIPKRKGYDRNNDKNAKRAKIYRPFKGNKGNFGRN